jgi:hypothetical protein
MDELAAWRQEVAARMGRKPVLRKAAIEFFPWCAPDAASSEAELTVLALVRTETDRRQLRKLKEHPSSRVRLRVRTLQTWLQGSGKGGAAPSVQPSGSSGPSTLTEALRHLHVTRSVPLSGRTWLRDRDLEELLFGAVARVEADFAARYPERFREDTSELVAGLLEGLRGELERVKADLSALLAQGQPAPLNMEFTVRRTRAAPEEGAVAVPSALIVEPVGHGGASEGPASETASEGAASVEPEVEVTSAAAVAPTVEVASVAPLEATPAPSARTAGGVAPRPSGVEVAVVLKVEVEGFLRTERVVFLRVVKLEQRGEGQWMPTFRLGRELVDSLLLRTDAAFCLFLAPPFPRAECWLVPARLVRGLMETQRSVSGVRREDVQRAARSLAQWLVGDLVGLWTGDERPEALARARQETDAPDFVVEWVLR